MRKIRIKRPACILCLVFTLLVRGIISATGGIDMKEYHSDATNIVVRGRIDNKSRKNDGNILYISGCKFEGTAEDEVETGTDLNIGNQAERKAGAERDSKTVRQDAKQEFLENNIKLIVYLKDQSINQFKIGQKVVIEGKYSNFSLPENEGQFDLRKYYRIKGYEAGIKSGYVVGKSIKYSYIRNALYNIKSAVGNTYDRGMKEEYSGTMKALLLGDKDDLNPKTKEIYQDAGISHILSLSGLHIATVGLGLYGILCKLGLGMSGSSVVSSVVMILYGIMTGLSTSTVRALIMFLLGVASKILGRSYDLLSAVAVSAVTILFENPYYVYDSGFQLSLCAVLGIAVICPIISSLTDFKIWKNLSVSISATLATLPVSISSFYKISRYGIFTNLLVVPLAGVVLFLGFISGIAGFFSEGIACIFLYPTQKILMLYDYLAVKTNDIAGNQWIIGRGETWRKTVYIILLCAAGLIGNYSNKEWKKSFRDKMKCYLRILSCILIVIGMFIVSGGKNFELEIRALSVGQGACNLVWGENMPVIMIDGGSSDVKDVYKYRIKPLLLYNGVDRLDYIFITHPDEDHISGIKDLLMDDLFDIGRIVMSTNNQEICNLAKAKGCEFILMKEGELLNSPNCQIECFNPETNDIEPDNESSLVLKITEKTNNYSMLFTGDIGAETEKKILEDYIGERRAGQLNKGISEEKYQGIYNYATVPHHGSRYSSSEEFLKYVNADIYTISAGKNNSYGHPHKEVLERLKEISPQSYIFRTDESGQISVFVNEGKVWAKSF